MFILDLITIRILSFQKYAIAFIFIVHLYSFSPCFHLGIFLSILFEWRVYAHTRTYTRPFSHSHMRREDT